MKHDVIVIGSGFGGGMAAHVLAGAGARVLMLERGDWIRRGPENWASGGCFDRSPAWTRDTPYIVRGDRRTASTGAFHCVGGPSLYYGGASLRFRSADFEPAPEIVGDSGARWPFGYDELEPYYTIAERLLGVAGDTRSDPTEPWRSRSLPDGADLTPASLRIDAAARRLDLHPSRLPLAIDFDGRRSARPCVRCGTCDAFACAIGAKNDIANGILVPLLGAGMRLRTGVVATRLLHAAGRVVAVECVDARRGTRMELEADLVVLAAGALASPHLVLASGLERWNPGGFHAGRWLMRHCSQIVYGIFPEPPGPPDTFHKQLCIHDYYFGHPSVREPAGKLGSLQQMHGPPMAYLEPRLPASASRLLPPLLRRMTALLAMAEDQPRPHNGVTLDPHQRDRYGRPCAIVTHRETRRDRHARRALSDLAARVLHAAGALATVRVPIRSFSHAIGTLRVGEDPRASVVDADGRYRGIENLVVTDGSVFASAGAVNPSLTIAALALRTADRLTGGAWGHSESAGRPLPEAGMGSATPVLVLPDGSAMTEVDHA